MKLQFSYSTLLLVVVGLAFLFLTVLDPFLGGSAWVALVFTTGVVALIRWGRQGLILTSGMAAVLIAHAFGYKIYGSPEIVHVALNSPSTIERLEKPNTLILSDGSKRKLDGVRFTQNVSLRPTQTTVDQMKLLGSSHQLSEEFQSEEFSTARVWWMLRAPRRRNLNVGNDFQAELTTAAGDAVRGKVLIERHYWCGNSFFARLYPQNLPSATRHDLGIVLVRAGVATPNSTDQNYSYELMFAEKTKYCSSESIR